MPRQSTIGDRSDCQVLLLVTAPVAGYLRKSTTRSKRAAGQTNARHKGNIERRQAKFHGKYGRSERDRRQSA
jgi:hypothetical protein